MSVTDFYFPNGKRLQNIPYLFPRCRCSNKEKSFHSLVCGIGGCDCPIHPNRTSFIQFQDYNSKGELSHG